MQRREAAFGRESYVYWLQAALSEKTTDWKKTGKTFNEVIEEEAILTCTDGRWACAVAFPCIINSQSAYYLVTLSRSQQCFKAPVPPPVLPS